jgi:hypothetical protein
LSSYCQLGLSLQQQQHLLLLVSPSHLAVQCPLLLLPRDTAAAPVQLLLLLPHQPRLLTQLDATEML